eukprot:CAMPEP_0198212926 /NCGR_PEP_ID=MMETSP1445-20131203/28295_1 /TAXON_ID=36898 /ORGANISM="Pyramimonas sp., Strain CCMP2087" /LENGTH=308 /DNA_ID=CAMNT_0043887497 /DNA_START=202 /DNA_END=1128 /DNA_ORIENTATION=+
MASSSATSAVQLSARISAQRQGPKNHQALCHRAASKASLTGTLRPRTFQLGHLSASKGLARSQRCRASGSSDVVDVTAEPIEPPMEAPWEHPVDAPEIFVLEGEVDVAAMLAASTFPIKPDELILKAKKYLACTFGVGDPSLLAEDFRFVAPVVGPLDKKTFLEAIASFEIKEAFPDFNPQYHDFRVDPFETNRVWLTARGHGTNTGKFAGALPATDKTVISPPQSVSITFNEKGLVTKYTIGYVMDREVGNTGGLGGVYGILYGIYPNLLQFPEAQPWSPSPQYQLFQATTGGIGKLFKFVTGFLPK